MKSFLKNLNIPKRINILFLTFLVGFAFCFYFIYWEKQISIQFAKKEIIGDDFLKELTPSYLTLIKNRPTKDYDEKVLSAPAVTNSISNACQAYGGLLQNKTDGACKKLQNSLLSVGKETSSEDPLDSVIDNYYDLMVKIGDESNLVLDPEIDSYYLMNNVVVNIPKFLDKASELITLVQGFVLQKKPLGDGEKVRLSLLAGELNSLDKNIASSYAAQIQKSPKERLGLAHQASQQAMGVFLSEIGKIIATQHYEEQWVPLSESYRKVFETTSAYWVTSIDELKILLENRVSNLNGSLLLVGGICGLILLCSLFLSVSLFKTICIPLERLVSVIQDVKNGRLMVEFPVIYYKDELHLINEELQKLYQVILESFRLKTGLERVGAGLMMTRANHEIIYINPALQKIFNLYEPIISKHMPGFNEFLNGIYVQSFNDFTTHPLNEAEGVGKILCTFEHVVFEIEANTIINHHGEELGFVFEWVDKTQEIKIQHEIEQMVLSAIEGNLTTHISVNDKQGFMLTLSEHINQFVTTIYSSLRDLKSLLSALSQGNLRYRLSGNYGGIFQEIQTDANATAEQLNLMVKAIVSSTDVITSAIEDMSLATDDLSKRTEKQASDLAVASNAMEDLSCTVNQNATNSKRANRFGKESHVVAEKGTNAVLQVAQTMQSIEESSQKIKDIMTLIDDIAFQTNLLALNAAVEAARAGTAGKGFAVVADEVRTLSQRCAEASKQVKVIISKSTNQVEDGVRLVEKARENLKEILHVTQEVALIIKEITYASDKQSSQLDEVRELVDSVDKETKKNVAMVDQGKMISITLQDQADRLSKSLGRFKV